MELVPINEGDFAVIRRRYNWAVLGVSKVTDKQIKAFGEWSSRDHTYQRHAVVFAGPEEDARRLYERLTSSEALCRDDERRANERRNKRNAELIAKARGQ